MISKLFQKKQKDSHSKFRINWSLHLVDLVVVIIGVTIAFAISNYAENRKNVREKNVFLQAMLNEIENDIDVYISHQISINLDHVDKIDMLMDIIQHPESYSDDTVTYYFSRAIFRFNNWMIGDATYKSITSTGKIDLVDNYDLKMEIIQLYESRAGQSGFIIQQSLDQNQKMMEYLEDHIDMSTADTWPIVFNEIKFKNLLNGLRDITASKVHEYRNNVEALQSLKNSIELELGINSTPLENQKIE